MNDTPSMNIRKSFQHLTSDRSNLNSRERSFLSEMILMKIKLYIFKNTRFQLPINPIRKIDLIYKSTNALYISQRALENRHLGIELTNSLSLLLVIGTEGGLDYELTATSMTRYSVYILG